MIGVGLFLMQRWARVVGLAVYILAAISQLLSVFTGGFSIYTLIGLVISIVVISVLNSEDVKQAFDRDTTLDT